MPERMCVGCRKMAPKRELIRLVLQNDDIVTDEKQKIQARGVYLCRRAECIAQARKKKALSRSFKRNVPDGVYERLTEVYTDG